MQTRKFDVQMNHKCVVCSKTVYPLEKITVSQKSFHRACFRCGECNSTLHPDMFVEKDNKFYCRRHVPSSTQKTSSEVSREERVDRLTEVSNTVSTSQGPEKKKFSDTNSGQRTEEFTRTKSEATQSGRLTVRVSS
jgi:hypothetical protein